MTETQQSQTSAILSTSKFKNWLIVLLVAIACAVPELRQYELFEWSIWYDRMSYIIMVVLGLFIKHTKPITNAINNNTLSELQQNILSRLDLLQTPREQQLEIIQKLEKLTELTQGCMTDRTCIPIPIPNEPYNRTDEMSNQDEIIEETNTHRLISYNEDYIIKEPKKLSNVNI